MKFEFFLLTLGGGQNLERINVKWLMFRKFETSNIETTKVELYDFFCFWIYFLCLRLFELSEHLKIWLFTELEIFGILVVLQSVKFRKFANFRNWTISEIWLFYELVNLDRKFWLEYEIKAEKSKRRNWFISKSKYENW